MKRRIHESRDGPGGSQIDQSIPFCPSLPSGTGQPDEAAVNALKSEDAHLMAPQYTPPLQTEEPTLSDKKGWLSWFRRLLFPGPPEPRKSQRESLSWLSAYFFTGGTPVAHRVRDVSSTGLYVFTDERWYVGTVVRITLTDLREPTAERSLTLNASVVRCGNDGVGLHFLLQDQKGEDSCLVPTLGNSLQPIGKPQLEGFVARLKNRIS